jgi:hypothetical protein
LLFSLWKNNKMNVISSLLKSILHNMKKMSISWEDVMWSNKMKASIHIKATCLWFYFLTTYTGSPIFISPSVSTAVCRPITGLNGPYGSMQRNL